MELLLNKFGGINLSALLSNLAHFLLKFLIGFSVLCSRDASLSGEVRLLLLELCPSLHSVAALRLHLLAVHSLDLVELSVRTQVVATHATEALAAGCQNLLAHELLGHLTRDFLICSRVLPLRYRLFTRFLRLTRRLLPCK